ncbi:MAG TPA: 3-oxoacyl-ACP reductase family protein [Candidatus Binatia bacterium]|jgi:3-oxoacyl-[acyl-carrier protein] reductase|nr:3-oxoacyl-ACP reductase family protein [Candidatus Binatia bacterium]
MRLKDKVAIVTGGGIGIGRAYCLALAREGAKVVAADIQEGEAKRVAEEIKKSGGEAMAVPVDVTSPEKTRAMADAALKRYGRIDILVNNAALYSAIKKKPFMEIDEEEWDRVMAVNIKGLFLCMQAVYPAMKRQGKGKIINISSGTALGGTPFYLHYVTSKAGVIGFTRALARELGGDNICVNAITPGLTISSPQQEGTLTPEQMADRRKKRSFQRDQKPEDLVGTVVFLASDDSDFITGQTINVDGGANMY